LGAGLVIVTLAWPTVLSAQSADEAGVRDAVLDYVEAIYEVAPERIDRSVSPDLVKRGYWRSEGETEYSESPMTFDQLRQLAGRWNANGHVDATAAVKEVVVLDVLDKTASAKLVADWGVDYMHLAKVDGRWMIKNILWQGPLAVDSDM
jgi:hypothetical protein